MEVKEYDPTLAEKAYAETKANGEKDLEKLFGRILENRKRTEEKTKIEKELLTKLKSTAPSEKDIKLYQEYRIKHREERITLPELKHYDQLLDEGENIRNDRVKILIELADLRKVSLSALIKMEDVKIPTYFFANWE